MALCKYYGLGWKIMNKIRKEEDIGDIQLDPHGLVGKVSNNALNETTLNSLHDFLRVW